MTSIIPPEGRVDFPKVIDSTMIAAFRACPKKFWWNYIRRIEPQGFNIHLHAGQSFAAGMNAARLAFYVKGFSTDDSIIEGVQALAKHWGTEFEAPEGENKSLDRMMLAVVEYFHEYPLETDIIKPLKLAEGKIATEVTFALPLEQTAHPATGDPILYAGRFDMIGEREGVLFIVDEKTTSQLGPTWPNQWTLRSQFTGYAWGAKSYGYPVAGAIIRGISILKEKYGHAQVITYRPEWQINRWLKQLERDLKRMIDSWATGEWDFNLDHSCSAYGACPYLRLCENLDPEPFVPLYYQENKWDPLKARE